MFYSKKLKKIKKIKHCFFSRRNGFSKGIYKGLNCGKGSKDKKINVKKNLDYVAKKMDIKRDKLILMHQTHSNKVVEIKKNNYKKKIIADAMITKMKGFALGVLTADCVPIVLYDTKNEIVGCIHAGWKGAFFGVIKNTIDGIASINVGNISIDTPSVDTLEKDNFPIVGNLELENIDPRLLATNVQIVNRPRVKSYSLKGENSVKFLIRKNHFCNCIF